MATAQSRAVVGPLAELATPRMPLASKSISGVALRPVQRSRVARRVVVRAEAVASPVKPTAPVKKGDVQISAEEAQMLYRDMVLGRDFEDMCAQMYYRGKMFGFVHLYSGQEAVSTGERNEMSAPMDSCVVCLFCAPRPAMCMPECRCCIAVAPNIPHPSAALVCAATDRCCPPPPLFAGVIKACLRKDDYISSTYRDHVHALSKGVSARKVMAELFGKKTGCCRGQGGSMHMFDNEHGLVSKKQLPTTVLSVA